MKILLVDDEIDARTVARLSLRQLAGFEVVEAANGSEALRLAASQPFDAIVLDVMMPDMDGPTVFEALRQRPETATTPIVFLTAKAMPDEVARLQKLGAAGIYTKPFDPAEFASAMRGLLTREPAPGPAAPGAPAQGGVRVDQRAMRQLVGLSTDRGTDLIGSLIDLFETNTPDLIARIESMTTAGASGEVERAAHTLKAGAATLGAVAIADVARTIEHAARDGVAINVRPHLDAIREQLAPTLAALRVERGYLIGKHESGR